MRLGPSAANFAGLHDVELAALAASGTRRAYGELVRRHGSSVRALLRRMGADAAAADDIAQDAFLQGFERIAEFRGDGAFSGWIRRIAARRFLRRRRKDAGRWLEIDALPEEAAPAPDPGARLDLDEALKCVSPVERLVLSLCYGAGLSHAEVAQSLELPVGTVKSHVKRGLEKLRGRLAAQSRPLGEVVHG